MIRLAHFHLCHPVKNFTRVEVAKDSAFELQEERRVNRVTEIQQRIWAGQPFAQIGFWEAKAPHLVEILGIAGLRLI